MATVVNFPITNVSVSGNQMSYTSAYNMIGLMLWDVNGNHGMGPPTIAVTSGSRVIGLPISVGGGITCELRNSANMTPVSARFVTSGDVPNPTPSQPAQPPQIPMYPYLPPFSLPTPVFPAISVGDDMRGCNEIEVDGRTVTIETDQYGKLFFFCNKKEGGRVILPKMISPGHQLSIYNWASAEGYGPETAKPILMCGQEADGKVYDMFPLQPGQKLTFVVIRATSGRLRWAPF
jgi:hypothetical protein